MAKKKAEEAFREHVEGYGPAKSPREACEQFLKAVQARNYKAAAVYSTKDYGDKLTKSHAGARDLGLAIDRVNKKLEDKQFKTDKSTQLLFLLDPFPAEYLKIGDVKEIKGKNDEKKQVGVFLFTPPPITEGYRDNELKGLDPKLFFGYRLPAPVLAPALAAPAVGMVAIKSEGEGETKVWKIDFQVPQVVHDGIEYFNSNYKRYVQAVDSFRDDLNRETFLKDKVAPELLSKLTSSK
ncbi:MAG TPA: hypothetical protein VKE98_14570 [Gemmataceae bacterium]|nr:hypothetical protein [Gemmataceae bacterium]